MQGIISQQMNNISVGSMMKKKRRTQALAKREMLSKHDQTLFGNQTFWCVWVDLRYQTYLNEQNVF